jgi:nitrosocyanin
MGKTRKAIQRLSFAILVMDCRDLLNKEKTSISKAMLKTMAVMAAVAAFMLPSAGRIAAAADAAPSAAAAPARAVDEPGTRKFTLVSVEVDNTKFWLPSVIAVEQGDKVTLTLKNQVPGAGPSNQHGFTIPAYNIAEIVTSGAPKKVTFVADKPGVFQYFCQLHLAHIGGSLIVLPKK